MNNPFITSKNVLKHFNSISTSIYADRFYSELSHHFSSSFFIQPDHKDFFSVETKNPEIQNLIDNSELLSSSHEIDALISRMAYSLLAFGKIYMYIYLCDQEDKEIINLNNVKTNILSRIFLRDMEGAIKEIHGDKCTFIDVLDNSITKERLFYKNRLIIFDLKELGYRRNYFSKIVKKLDKYTPIFTLDYCMNNNYYDPQTVHSKLKLLFLKQLRSIGWCFDYNDISESYRLYKIIQKKKFKLKLMHYFLKKINNYFEILFSHNSGIKFTANILELDYDKLWYQYSNGEIDSTQLIDILFNNKDIKLNI